MRLNFIVKNCTCLCVPVPERECRYEYDLFLKCVLDNFILKTNSCNCWNNPPLWQIWKRVKIKIDLIIIYWSITWLIVNKTEAFVNLRSPCVSWFRPASSLYFFLGGSIGCVHNQGRRECLRGPPVKFQTRPLPWRLKQYKRYGELLKP